MFSMSPHGPSVQMLASNKLVTIGATTDIRARHELARNDAIDPKGDFCRKSGALDLI